MEGIEIRGKDVIVHEEMTEEERNAELERLKKESEDLTEWEEEQIPPVSNGRWFFVRIFRLCDVATGRSSNKNTEQMEKLAETVVFLGKAWL